MQRLKAVLCTVPWNCDRTLPRPINALPPIRAQRTATAASLISAEFNILKVLAQSMPLSLLQFLKQCVSLFRCSDDSQSTAAFRTSHNNRLIVIQQEATTNCFVLSSVCALFRLCTVPLCTAPFVHCSFCTLLRLCTAPFVHCSVCALFRLCPAPFVHCSVCALLRLCPAPFVHCSVCALLRLLVLSLRPDVGRTFENQQTVN